MAIMGLPSFVVENWVEFVVGVLVIFLRMYARGRVVGFLPSKAWHGDDWLAILVLLLYTAEACSIHNSSRSFSILPLVANPALVAQISPEQARSARSNGHSQLFGWFSYIHLIWCLKASLLFLYRRLTRNLVGFKWMMNSSIAVVAVTYLIAIFSICFHCYPISKNWIVYPMPDKCILSEANALIIFLTNLISDMILFCIPAYLLWKVQYSLKKKILIGLSICSGIFDIAAVVVRNAFVIIILNLNKPEKAATVTASLLEWSVREPFISVIIVCIPSITPLFTKRKEGSADVSPASPVQTASRLREIIRKRLGRGKVKPQDAALHSTENSAATASHYAIDVELGMESSRDEKDEKDVSFGGLTPAPPKMTAAPAAEHKISAIEPEN